MAKKTTVSKFIMHVRLIASFQIEMFQRSFNFKYLHPLHLVLSGRTTRKRITLM